MLLSSMTFPADDMGLGKTLTMISLVAMKKERSKSSDEKKEKEWLKNR